jgi:hypothetical protein
LKYWFLRYNRTSHLLPEYDRGIEFEEIAEGLHSDDCAGHGILFVSDPLRRLSEISQTGAWTQAHRQSHTGMMNSSLKRRRMTVFRAMAFLMFPGRVRVHVVLDTSSVFLWRQHFGSPAFNPVGKMFASVPLPAAFRPRPNLIFSG